MTRRVGSLGTRLLWFAGLWLASVTTVGLVSEVIRMWLQP